jgi:hypothetical protein
MNKTLMIAETALREVARRRSVLAILLLLPLAFYLSRRGDHLGESIRFVCLGLGWAQSTAALFTGSAARAMEPRLTLSGYRSRHLFLGRLLALWTIGAAMTAPYFLLILLDQHDVRYGAIALAMALTIAVSAPFGLALSAVVAKELEGTLLLLVIVGLQMMMDPDGTAARLLPFWFDREIATYAIDHTGGGYLVRGLADAVVVTAVLVALVAAASGIRLRRRRHMRPLSA